ncbi:MAG TPA: hypothetical protein VME47_19680 [Acetobacteraceae bacterium]|nr:hypothetical protein [Acetobacteraceae bacterium]
MYWNAASDEHEAELRAQLFRIVDPFPTVPPALLSSAEIADYARVTAMLFPFFPTRDRLKGASYEVQPGGRYTYWDESGRIVQEQIGASGTYNLRANSITFVQLESKFFLPDYIAARFNLRIKHVHRGILLGTGPLVDPGFKGNLLIPLHNLTSDDYEISGNEGLIWVEFTKTSWRPSMGSRYIEDQISDRLGKFFSIPRDKTDLPPETYFQKANGGMPIRSSIPDAIRVARENSDRARESANLSETNVKDARRETERISRRFRNLGLAGFFGGLIALVAILVGLCTAMISVSQSVQTTHTLAAAVQSTADKAKSSGSDALALAKSNRDDLVKIRNMNATEERLASAEASKIDALQKQIDKVVSEMDQAIKTLDATVPRPTGKRK